MESDGASQSGKEIGRGCVVRVGMDGSDTEVLAEDLHGVLIWGQMDGGGGCCCGGGEEEEEVDHGARWWKHRARSVEEWAISLTGLSRNIIKRPVWRDLIGSEAVLGLIRHWGLWTGGGSIWSAISIADLISDPIADQILLLIYVSLPLSNCLSDQ